MWFLQVAVVILSTVFCTARPQKQDVDRFDRPPFPERGIRPAPHVRPQPGIPYSSTARIPILSLKFNREPRSYSYSFLTGNGISSEEVGEFLPGETEETGTSIVKGSYRYTAPDGKEIVVTYIADENGFQPTGNHIPSLQRKARAVLIQ